MSNYSIYLKDVNRGECSMTEILDWEIKIFKVLDYNLIYSTTESFIRYMCTDLRSDILFLCLAILRYTYITYYFRYTHEERADAILWISATYYNHIVPRPLPDLTNIILGEIKNVTKTVIRVSHSERIIISFKALYDKLEPLIKSLPD